MDSRSHILVPQPLSPLKQSSDPGLGGVAFDYSTMPRLVAAHSLSVKNNTLANEDISSPDHSEGEVHSTVPVASNEKTSTLLTLPVAVRSSIQKSHISVKLPLPSAESQEKIKNRKVKERKTRRNGTPDPGAIKRKSCRPPKTDKSKSMPLNVQSCSESSQLLQRHPNQDICVSAALGDNHCTSKTATELLFADDLDTQLVEQEVRRISDSIQERQDQLCSAKKTLRYRSSLGDTLNGPVVSEETSSTNHFGKIESDVARADVAPAKDEWSNIGYISLHEGGESPIRDIETPSVQGSSFSDYFEALRHTTSTNLQIHTKVNTDRHHGFSTIVNTSVPVTGMDKGITTSVASSQVLNKTYSSFPCSVPSLFVQPLALESCRGQVASRNPVQMEDLTEVVSQDHCIKNCFLHQESHVHTNEPSKTSINSQPAGESDGNTKINLVERGETTRKNRRKSCTPRKLIRLASVGKDSLSFKEERPTSSVQLSDSALTHVTPNQDGNASAICDKDRRIVPTFLDFNTSELHRRPLMYERMDPYLKSKGEDQLTKPRPGVVYNTAGGMLWDSPPVLKTQSEVGTTYDHNSPMLREGKIRELLQKQEKLLQQIKK